MEKNLTREDILKAIEKVEHPEIAATLIDLGMILDVAVNGDQANVAMALPLLGIPEAVRLALVESIRKPIEALGLHLHVDFFEMTPEARERFFAISKANWKGAI
jgi:metal-sulfur cluster biosynthetic enzyme